MCVGWRRPGRARGCESHTKSHILLRGDLCRLMDILPHGWNTRGAAACGKAMQEEMWNPELHQVFTGCIQELVRQLSVTCMEQGQLLAFVWSAYVQSLQQMQQQLKQQQRPRHLHHHTHHRQRTEQGTQQPHSSHSFAVAHPQQANSSTNPPSSAHADARGQTSGTAAAAPDIPIHRVGSNDVLFVNIPTDHTGAPPASSSSPLGPAATPTSASASASAPEGVSDAQHGRRGVSPSSGPAPLSSPNSTAYPFPRSRPGSAASRSRPGSAASRSSMGSRTYVALRCGVCWEGRAA